VGMGLIFTTVSLFRSWASIVKPRMAQHCQE